MLSLHHVWLWGSCHKHLQARKTFFINFSVYFSYYKSGNLKKKKNKWNKHITLQTFVLMNFSLFGQQKLNLVISLACSSAFSFLLNRKLWKCSSLHLHLILTAQEQFSAVVLIDCSSIMLSLWWWRHQTGHKQRFLVWWWPWQQSLERLSLQLHWHLQPFSLTFL